MQNGSWKFVMSHIARDVVTPSVVQPRYDVNRFFSPDIRRYLREISTHTLQTYLHQPTENHLTPPAAGTTTTAKLMAFFFRCTHPQTNTPPPHPSLDVRYFRRSSALILSPGRQAPQRRVYIHTRDNIGKPNSCIQIEIQP